jgi:hypothetical protein
VGIFNVIYTVKDLANRVVQSLTNVAQKLKHQFDQFMSAKIHPLLFRPSFDISFFDKQGNKTFSNQPETHQVGPPGLTKTYITPTDWIHFKILKIGNELFMEQEMQRQKILVILSHHSIDNMQALMPSQVSIRPNFVAQELPHTDLAFTAHQTLHFLKTDMSQLLNWTHDKERKSLNVCYK